MLFTPHGSALSQEMHGNRVLPMRDTQRSGEMLWVNGLAAHSTDSLGGHAAVITHRRSSGHRRRLFERHAQRRAIYGKRTRQGAVLDHAVECGYRDREHVDNFGGPHQFVRHVGNARALPHPWVGTASG
jgi:hypothetical protein